jgi:hypothetical protein
MIAAGLVLWFFAWLFTPSKMQFIQWKANPNAMQILYICTFVKLIGWLLLLIGIVRFAWKWLP